MVLGIGALGCGVIMDLLRIGIKTLFILDYDVV